eukprot:351742-Chlamydomonas_euryale.AAC.3
MGTSYLEESALPAFAVTEANFGLIIASASQRFMPEDVYIGGLLVGWGRVGLGSYPTMRQVTKTLPARGVVHGGKSLTPSLPYPTTRHKGRGNVSLAACVHDITDVGSV